MTRSHKVLGFLLVALLGIYGCARGPAAAPHGEKAALEAKVQRLEEDLRAAAAARDSFRQRLLTTEEKQTQTQRALDQAAAGATKVAKERDAARAERDALHAQYDGFRKNIRELLGQAETALGHPPAGGASPTVAVGTQTSPTATNGARN
jgi:septal ring factor EnvC (AmiA/AmiB activator)